MMDRSLGLPGGGVADSGFQLGLLALRRGDLPAAARYFQEVCTLAPHHAEAWHLVGVAALRQGDLEKARRSIERSLLVSSTNSSCFLSYALLLTKLNRPRDALKMLRRASVIAPESAEAWEQFGALDLNMHGPTARAERSLQRSLELEPDRPGALGHLGRLHLRAKRFESARGCLERLHALRPHDVDVMGLLAEACEKVHDLEGAVSLVRKADILSPDNARIQHDLGRLHGGLGGIAQAKFHFQRAAALPGGRPEWRWKHLGSCPHVFETDEQIARYWEGLEQDLDAAIAEGDVYDWRTLPQHGFTSPFQLPHLDRCCRVVKEKFTELFARSFELPCFERPTPRGHGEKVRVGFLVTPGHEGGFLRLTRPIIERLDGGRFEPVLIYHQQSEKRLSRHFWRADLRRVAFSADFEPAVRTIRAVACDVIYYWKVGADVWSLFLPMARLAPVQCTSWSTHGTSGSRFVDYYVSWDLAETTGAEQHYTERLFLLDCSPLYEPRLALPAEATRGQLGLPQTGAIYFCPHRPAKYHPKFDAYLREILCRDSTGHVVLLVGKDPHVANRLKERIRRNLGPRAASRVIFLPQQSVDSYYRHLSVATAVLNSPVYAGEITSIDGFLYGVPSVADTGELLVQRYTTAFYDYMGIDDLAQNDRPGYVDEAVRLGTDGDYRRQISHLIVERSERFFDRRETIEQWEAFFETAFARQVAGGLPCASA